MRFYTQSHLHYCGIDLHVRVSVANDLITLLGVIGLWH